MEKIILQPGEEKTVELDHAKQQFHFPQGERNVLTSHLGDHKWLVKNTGTKKPIEVHVVSRRASHDQ